MSVRAKFRLTSITENAWNPGQKTLHFDAMYDDSIPEDRRFSDATPSGHLEMVVNNPAAIAALKLGEYYYLDLTLVPSDNAS